MGQRREREATEEWREKYRVRAGIESLNRGLDRSTGLKELRVRGERAVSHSLYSKVMGWNIIRAARGLAQRARQAMKLAAKAAKRNFPTIAWIKALVSNQRRREPEKGTEGKSVPKIQPSGNGAWGKGAERASHGANQDRELTKRSRVSRIRERTEPPRPPTRSLPRRCLMSLRNQVNLLNAPPLKVDR